MKKLLLVSLILIVSVMCFGGCGMTKQSEKDNKTPEVTNAKEVKDKAAIEESDKAKVDEIKTPEPPNVEYESYEGDVPHIFIHTLIAYPEHKQANGRMVYDSECINVTEYKNMLRELYNNGYSLVDIHKLIVDDGKGNVTLAKSIEVPKGRKPVVITVDDVTYDWKKRGNGMVDKLVIDGENNIISVTSMPDGTVEYSDDNEFVPILEKFIKENPEFSAKGDKMTLGMTGFAGQFGYRTDANYEGDRETEIAEAKKVADRLKEMGYTFASHSYGHPDVTKLSYDAFVNQLKWFQDEAVPVIGPVKVFIYPYGKNLQPEETKYQVALDYGFKMFCSVSHFFYSKEYVDQKSLYMTRVAVDGYSLRMYKHTLASLFDTEKVLDYENRP